jgi:hypothetical protein
LSGLATNLAGGTIGALHYQSASNASGFISYPGAGYALTSVGAGTSSVWQLLTAMTVGSATTATNAGFAGAATTATSAGSAGTSVNAGFAGAATTAVNAGFAGAATTAVNSGFAGAATTATNAGFAGSSTNSANTNITLDTTSTIYLTGSRSNSSIGSTPVYVLSGVSALGNTITASTFTGSLSGTASSAALVNVAASTGTRFLAGFSLNTATGSTQLFTGSGITIGDNRLTTGGLAVTAGAASTNTLTGALTVAGGVGITGQLSVNTIALGSTGVSVTPSMTYVGTAGTVISMSVLSDTTIAWEGSSGQLFSIDNNLSSGEIFSVSDISGLPVITASAGQTITLNEFGGYTQVGNGLASTSTTTGALRVIGGVGVTGSLYLGSPLLVPSGGTGLTSYTTGDVLYASSSTTIGRISAGAAGSVLTSAGAGTTPYWANTLAIAGTNNGDIQYKSASALGASSAFNFDASTSTFKLTGFPIEAVSSTSANVKILGGSVSWSGSINGTMLAVNTANTYTGDLLNAQIGGTSRFKVSYTGAVSIGNSYTLPITDGAVNQVLQTNGSGAVSWVNSVISSAQYNIGYYESAGAAVTGSSTFTNNTSTRVVSIGHTTASTGFSSGALVVTGGVGVGASVNIAGNTSISSSTASTSTSTGALVVTGGVGIGASLNIAGNTIISSSIASTTATTGALVVTGGVGIGGTLNVGGNIRAGTNTFSKAGLSAGDVLLDNGTVDTPGLLFYWGNNRNIGIDTFYGGTGATRIRIVKELNESGGSELWSIDRNGIITRSAWDVGEVIASRMYNFSDLNMSATTTVGINTYVRIANLTYTPKSSSSHIWIEFSCVYEIAGAAADDFYSNITVNGTEIVYNRQIWINNSGGGTRSGTLFPISARYTNSSTSGIAITVQAARGSSDDNGTFAGNSVSGFMRIMEIGR